MRVGIINMIMNEHGLRLSMAVSEQKDSFQEELRDKIEVSSGHLRDVKGIVKDQALADKENRSLLEKLCALVVGEVVAPLMSLTQMLKQVG